MQGIPEYYYLKMENVRLYVTLHLRADKPHTSRVTCSS